MALIEKVEEAIRISRHCFLLPLLITKAHNRFKFLGDLVKIRRFEIEFEEICWPRVLLFLILN